MGRTPRLGRDSRTGALVRLRELTCSAAVRLLAPPGPPHRTAAARLRTRGWRRRLLRESGEAAGARRSGRPCARREREKKRERESEEREVGGGLEGGLY